MNPPIGPCLTISLRPSLLHNMSVPPRTTAHHVPKPGRPFGVGIVFEISEMAGRSRQPLAVAELRSMLGLKISPNLDREKQLRDELERIASELPLPASAIVTDKTREGDKYCPLLPSALAVIAKSSRSVYLRNKEPNLTRLIPGTRVILIVPKEFADAF